MRSDTITRFLGLDIRAAPLDKRPGTCSVLNNYDVTDEGTTSVKGYERWNGTGLPSEEPYYLLSTVPKIENNQLFALQVVGATSGADSWILGESAGRLVITGNGTADYVDGEALTIASAPLTNSSGEQLTNPGGDALEGAIDLGVADGSQTSDTVSSTQDRGGFHRLAATFRRSQIFKPPGEGPIRGVFRLAGVDYAFRDDADPATACKLFRSNATAGWQAVTTPALVPGGTFEIVVTNFTGGAGGFKAYGVDGKNKAFSFNEASGFVQITTGMTVDVPTAIAEHQKHLFLGFYGSVQVSPIGDPEAVWEIVSGADEMAVGDIVVKMISEVSGESTGRLLIWCRQSMYRITGTSTADFQLLRHNAAEGTFTKAVPYVGYPVFYTARGLTTLEPTDRFGEFEQSVMDRAVAPLTLSVCNDTDVIAWTVPTRNLARWCSGRQGFALSFENGKPYGFSSFTYEHDFACAWTDDRSTEGEYILAGTTDGWVMRMESGPSFDGEAIESFMVTNPVFQKRPQQRKLYARPVLYAKAGFWAEITTRLAFSYGEHPFMYGARDLRALMPAGGRWNFSRWGEFVWGKGEVNMITLPITGAGVNLSLSCSSSSDIAGPHTIQSLLIPYNWRGLRRGK